MKKKLIYTISFILIVAIAKAQVCTDIISSFTPTSAKVGDYVTIKIGNALGAHLTSGVYFGGVLTTNFTGKGTIIAMVPQGAQSGDISVSDFYCSGKISKSGFVVLPPTPIINSFTPILATNGTTDTITGKYFTNTTSVMFGLYPALNYTVLNDSTIIAIVGAGTSGYVSVTTGGGGGTSTLSGFKYYFTPPTITSFSPKSAPTGGIDTIKGFAFAGTQSVKFGNDTAKSFKVLNNSTIIAVVGTGSSGRINVKTIGGSDSLSGFTYLAPPVIKSFSPTSGGIGDTITIKGSGLISAFRVVFNTSNSKFIKVLNDSTLIAVVIGNQSGNISVFTHTGLFVSNGFTYLPTPSLTSFTPKYGRSGTTITISGSVFTGATSVSFGNVFAKSFSVINDNTITAVLDSGATGKVYVARRNATDSLSGFTYFKIKSFSPNSASTSDTILIKGTGLTGATNILFGGYQASYFKIINDSTIKAVVGKPKSGSIAVITSYGTDTLSGFVCIPKPYLISFSPNITGYNGTVTIRGLNFTGTSSVIFGGTPANNFTVVNDSTITATVGKGSSGNISVTTSLGTVNLGGFTYQSPIIKSFSSTYGPTVTIKGSGFTGTKKVVFGTIPCSDFLVLDDNNITAIVGSGESGNIYVSNTYGTDSIAGFIYQPLINTSDSLALVDLFINTFGPVWTNSNNWLTKARVSTWYGVKVDKSTGRVINLLLYSNNLVGTLPKTLGNLTSIKYIDFSRNKISGDIPASVGNLTNATNLNFSSNQLSGVITPSSFAAVKGLNISNNNFNFNGLENLSASSDIVYAPQPNLSIINYEKFLEVSAVAAGGTLAKQTFTWYKDNVPVATKVGTSAFYATAPGTYYATVNDSLAPKFTLVSNTVKISSSLFTPVITTYSPFSFCPNTIDTITITGDNFLGTKAVNIGGKPVTAFSVNSNSSITVLVPENSSGSVTVTNQYGSDTSKINLEIMPLTSTLYIELMKDLKNNYYLNITADNTAYYNADIPLDGLPETISFGPDNTILVANAATAGTSLGYISIINPITKKTITTLNNYWNYQVYTQYNTQFAYFEPIYACTPEGWIGNSQYGVTVYDNRGVLIGVFAYNAGVYQNLNIQDKVSSCIANNRRVNYPIDQQLPDGGYHLYDQIKMTINNCNITAPVTLAFFNATNINNKINVNWHTATELNTSHFIIQHSTDGSSFTDIGTVKAIGIGANGYSFTDNTPTNGINYYRLQSVDKDGSFTYSKVVSVQLSIINSQLSIFPNPAKDRATISFGKLTDKAIITVYDITGKAIITQQINNSTNTYQLNTQKLTKGIYIVKVKTGTGSVNGKLVIER